ncbi:MAG: YraN family protein [Clostridia bacterium]|nr:YraN family protein [Clostridia bacterium]
MLFYRQSIGKTGEIAAAKFLKKLGYKIVEMNYKNRYGEIDIIARDKNYTVFVEVKTRTSTDFGYAAEAVNYKKQQKIITVAQMYPGITYNSYMRYDIIEVYIDKTSKKVTDINHIKNAFMQ